MEDKGEIRSQHVVANPSVMSGEQFDTLLINNPWINRLVKEVSAWAEWRFKQPKDRVEQELWWKLWTKFDTIRDLSRLESWLYTAARYYCLNRKDQLHREDTHRDKITSQNWETTRRNGNPIIQCTTESTPEQALLQIEQEKEDERVYNERLKRLRKVTEAFPEWLVNGWRMGKTPKEISQEYNKPLPTVYRKLKRMQKAIKDEFRDGI